MVHQSSLNRSFAVCETRFGLVIVLSDVSYRVVSDVCVYDGARGGAGAARCGYFDPPLKGAPREYVTPLTFKYVQSEHEYSSRFLRGTMVMIEDGAGASPPLPVISRTRSKTLETLWLLPTEREYKRAMVCPFFFESRGLDEDTSEFPGFMRIANIFSLRERRDAQLDRDW